MTFCQNASLQEIPCKSAPCKKYLCSIPVPSNNTSVYFQIFWLNLITTLADIPMNNFCPCLFYCYFLNYLGLHISYLSNFFHFYLPLQHSTYKLTILYQGIHFILSISSNHIFYLLCIYHISRYPHFTYSLSIYQIYICLLA